jgi:hypothetical protein
VYVRVLVVFNCSSLSSLRLLCLYSSQLWVLSCAYISIHPWSIVNTRKTKSNKEKQEGTIRALGDLFFSMVCCVCLVVIGVPTSSYTRNCVTRIWRVVLPLDLSSYHEIARSILGKANRTVGSALQVHTSVGRWNGRR